MRVLMAADLFPPHCGGAGWSSYHLARALQQRGHQVAAVIPREAGKRRTERVFGGVTVREYPYSTPPVPLLRNLFRNELLWPRLGRFLAAQVRAGDFDIIHAQHSLTIPAAVYAGHILSSGRGPGRTTPIVATVRDYWPLCYRSTFLGHRDHRCSHCDLDAVVRCMGRPLGPLAPLMALAYPYIRSNVRRKARALARADATIAVSRYVAGRLSGTVHADRLHVLPNLVDLEEIEPISAQEPATPISGPFLLFVGKTEANKGVRELVAALEIVSRSLPAEERLPLLIAGDGTLRGWMEEGLKAIPWPARFLRWADHDEVLRLLRRTELLLFPSRWEEPLSRVLLEACACATPILAMATGGTPEILTDGVSGALVPPDVEAFATRLRALLPDRAERHRLGTGARREAEARFAGPVVAQQVENLYRSLLR